MNKRIHSDTKLNITDKMNVIMKVYIDALVKKGVDRKLLDKHWNNINQPPIPPESKIELPIYMRMYVDALVERGVDKQKLLNSWIKVNDKISRVYKKTEPKQIETIDQKVESKVTKVETIKVTKLPKILPESFRPTLKLGTKVICWSSDGQQYTGVVQMKKNKGQHTVVLVGKEKIVVETKYVRLVETKFPRNVFIDKECTCTIDLISRKKMYPNFTGTCLRPHKRQL